MYEDRSSDSPYIETVWHTQSDINGCNIVIADGSWDLQIRREGTITTALICGATSKAAPVPYSQGSECLGIRFKLGTFMPHMPATTVLDITTMLPNATSQSFWLCDSPYQFPNYDNVEAFVARLVRSGLLAHDRVVDAVLQDQQQGLSLRAVQRRFLRATGLTYNYLRQIERARQATALLQQGMSIPEATYQSGYADQPHMTRSLKHLMGQTPAQIARMRNP